MDKRVETEPTSEEKVARYIKNRAYMFGHTHSLIVDLTQQFQDNNNTMVRVTVDHTQLLVGLQFLKGMKRIAASLFNDMSEIEGIRFTSALVKQIDKKTRGLTP